MLESSEVLRLLLREQAYTDSVTRSRIVLVGPQREPSQSQNEKRPCKRSHSYTVL